MAGATATHPGRRSARPPTPLSIPTNTTATTSTTATSSSSNHAATTTTTDSPRSCPQHVDASPSAATDRKNPTCRIDPSSSTTPTSAAAAAALSLSSTPTCLRRYVSRRSDSAPPRTMPRPDDFVGMYSPWAWVWGTMSLTAPFSYVYIALVLLRELCLACPTQIYHPMKYYVPYLASLVDRMHQSYRVVEYWCWIEGAFYIGLKLHIRWLQMKDPLEASLSAAPLMELEARQTLWERLVECEKDDLITFLRGWFFDVEDIETDISKYDVRDFLAWCMFETRHQEHLTNKELHQLESFVSDLEYRISIQLYGVEEGDEEEESKEIDESRKENEKDGNKTAAIGTDEEEDGIPSCNTSQTSTTSSKSSIHSSDSHRSHRNGVAPTVQEKKQQRPQPRKLFRFSDETNDDEPNHFFFDVYESYRIRYQQLMQNLNTAVEQAAGTDFHPVKDLREMVNTKVVTPLDDLRNKVAETGSKVAESAHKSIASAEESAYATASQMYETLIQPGSDMDKRLSAVSSATYQQLAEAWNSVKDMKDRLKTARFLSRQRQRIRQQLKGYRVMLNRMREMSSAVPSKQMAYLMRRITECNQSLELLENRAQTAFVQATGFARSNLPLPFAPQPKTPRHYARYSCDPLLGIATYPLGFHLLMLGGTEIPLRIMMHRRGFERRTIGSVSYYFHPGKAALAADEDYFDDLDDDNFSAGGGSTSSFHPTHDDDDEANTMTPIVFVHGIGIGLIVYIPLIDKLLETGRPILLPEISYVSAFRPWQNPWSVLSPATVASTMTAMLASHGFLRGTWVGHSYGTSWLSYMVQFAPNAVASIVFLDPICFCLHVPMLTKQFVYQRPDPGTIAYVVRTDIIVNWTIQRAFPWAWMILFFEQVQVPCAVFLSDKDALVPAVKVEEYLKTKGVFARDFDSIADNEHFDCPFSVTVFRGDGHGFWTERPSETVPTIADAVETLCKRAEQEKKD